MREKPSVEQIKALLHYDPDSGIFIWKKRPEHKETLRGDRGWNAKYPGKRAGSRNRVNGYRYISIFDYPYVEHALAMAYMDGVWAPDMVDHKDMDRANNKFDNLRKCSNSENMHNRGAQANNVGTGIKGVRKNNSGYWSSICVNGNRIYLGTFRTAEEAHQAYCDAAQRYMGEFARAA